MPRAKKKPCCEPVLPTVDIGALICGHENRIHYLGGGIHVCFECWLKALLPGRVPSKKKRARR